MILPLPGGCQDARNIRLTSLAIVVTPSVRPVYLPGSVCKRVFTTSSGMTVRWVVVHPTAPHAAKSAKSTAVSLRSCGTSNIGEEEGETGVQHFCRQVEEN